MQRPDSRANDRDDDGTQKHVPGNLDAMDESSSLYQTDTTEQTVARESESDSDSNEDSNDETQLVGSVEGESDFGDTELEKLDDEDFHQEIQDDPNTQHGMAETAEKRPKGGQIRYYNRWQQLELVLAAQELSEIGGCEDGPTTKGDKVEMKGSDIWQDATYLALLREGMLPEMIEL
ncbi:unnamed protein product [Sphagnum troendelagicum]|uniref:Uncharacterized protein n=1 Tax=Sphagnum troendelagicum TaxID=128251 RepID=A0ABP0UV02_9BRYO